MDVWQDGDDGQPGPGQAHDRLAVLGPEERERLASLRDDRRAREFVRGRSLCRRVLSRYAPVPPETWRFALGPRGKPMIAAPTLAVPLWFGLAHADGVSVCAVTGAGPRIGIDIESVDRGDAALGVAEHFFSDRERTALGRVPAAQRGESFIRLWALKESLVKARESSLADDLAGTTFAIARSGEIAVSFDASSGERAADWRFALFGLDRARVVALAVQTHAAGPLAVRAGADGDLAGAGARVGHPPRE